MSPRRPKYESALNDLRLLPRVLKALEVLNEKQEEVRALMGRTTADVRQFDVIKHGAGPERLGVVLDRERGALHGLSSGPALLDTPERQEFDAARRAGKVVPPDLANISEAQRERMAEQKALVEQMRAARGQAPSVTPQAGPSEEVPVREEVLPESGNGSAGAELQSGGFVDG